MAQHPLYQGFSFPEYEYREYPKWIEGPAGQRALVHSAGEDLQQQAEWNGQPVPNALTQAVKRGRPSNAEIAARKAASEQ